MAFTALAAIVLIVTALLLLTGQPKAATRHDPCRNSTTSPAIAIGGPLGATRYRAGTSSSSETLSAPVEWILLVFAIVALGFAAWLWLGWGRSRPPSVPA